ncbi:MAG: hypothetical protein J6V68_04045 [Clostridia bacterium]|nr:hypothetical protein [Clostridia bacterium]
MNKIINFFKNNKTAQVIFISILCVIILVIAISSFNNVKSKDTVSSYATMLEEKLIDTLSTIDGVGKIKVALTVSSENYQEIAYETTVKDFGGTTETVTSPIIINGEPVVIKTCYPEILGVVIVAEGANDYLTCFRLVESTANLLKISVDKINVYAMK